MPDREHPLACQWEDITAIDKSLRSLLNAGLGTGNLGYDILWKQRGALFGKLGHVRPTVPVFIKYLASLSPGTLRLFHSGGFGFMVELRELEGAPPHYKHISDDLAVRIIKEELTHEEFEELSAEDSYLGE